MLKKALILSCASTAVLIAGCLWLTKMEIYMVAAAAILVFCGILLLLLPSRETLQAKEEEIDVSGLKNRKIAAKEIETWRAQERLLHAKIQDARIGYVMIKGSQLAEILRMMFERMKVQPECYDSLRGFLPIYLRYCIMLIEDYVVTDRASELDTTGIYASKKVALRDRFDQMTEQVFPRIEALMAGDSAALEFCLTLLDSKSTGKENVT